MYNQITSNKRKSFLLMIIFAVVIIGLGWLFNNIYGQGNNQILILSILIATSLNMSGYFWGDKMAIASAGAKQIEKNDNPYLWNTVENLTITAGLPMPKVYIIPENSINAFAAGRDPKHAIVAVTIGAIKKLNNEELEGVIAHELSHIKNYDIRLMTIVIVCVGIVAFMADIFLRGHLFSRKSNENNNGVLVVIGIVLAILAPIFASLIQLAVSRQREYLADASASLLTRYPEGLANALKKIKQDAQPLQQSNRAMAHLYISDPQAKFSQKLASWFSTHPPIDDRIKKLQEMSI